MGQTTKQERLDRLQGVGIEGSMSRSESGSEMVRGRRAAQREAEFSQRFNPDEFKVDSHSRMSLRLKAQPDDQVESPTWTMGNNVKAGSNGSPLWGYRITDGTNNDTRAIYLWWPVPEWCDKTRPLKVQFNHLIQAVISADRWYKFQYSMKAYTATHGTDWDAAADETNTHEEATTVATAAYTELGVINWTLAPNVAFPSGALAIAFKIEREDPAGGTEYGNDIIIGRPTLSYGLRYLHTHE